MSELVEVGVGEVDKLFKEDGNIESLLKEIRTKATSEIHDISTAKGRKDLASMARKVASSKCYIDDLGKDLVSGIKKQAKVIDATRKMARDNLDALKEEIRTPLDEWEAEREKVDNRIEQFRNYLKEETYGVFNAEFIFANIQILKRDDSELIVEDKREEYIDAKAEVLPLLEDMHEKRIKYEAEQRELEVFRIKKQEEEQEANNKKIAEQAAEQERKRIENEQKQKEIDEAAAKQKAEQEEQARINNIEHRKKINNEVLNALKVNCGIETDDAKRIIGMIAKNQIPNVTINY